GWGGDGGTPAEVAEGRRGAERQWSAMGLATLEWAERTRRLKPCPRKASACSGNQRFVAHNQMGQQLAQLYIIRVGEIIEPCSTSLFNHICKALFVSFVLGLCLVVPSATFSFTLSSTSL